MHFKHTHSFRYYTTSFKGCQGRRQEYWCIYTIFTHLCCANKRLIFSVLKNVYSRINCLNPVNRSQNGHNFRWRILCRKMCTNFSAKICTNCRFWGRKAAFWSTKNRTHIEGGSATVRKISPQNILYVLYFIQRKRKECLE